MDRQTVYAGQIPLETDVLLTNKNAMVGLAKLCAAVLGTNVVVNGFTCTPTTPASLNILITPGEVYQIENTEQSIWSSLAPDTHSIIKQGILFDPATFGITPPGTVGFSQSFLIECQYQDIDAGSLVLPYFNAANPSVPFSGPGNAGTAQNTVRKGVAALQVKAGVAAATGSQVVPNPDAGWTSLFFVTLANGAATITSGNITQLPYAPFLLSTLTDVPSNIQYGTWSYGDDVGTANNVVATLSPIPLSYRKGMHVRVKMLSAPTGASVVNFNTLGNKSVVKSGGLPLVGREWSIGDIVPMTYDGTNFQIQSPTGIRPVLTSAAIYYVNGTTGSDSNSGLTAGSPFLTIQKAVDTMAKFDNNGFDVTIIVADYGTGYGNTTLPRITGSGRCLIIGNITTPANCLCTGFGGTGTNGLYWIQGFRIVNAGGDAIFGDLSGTIFYISNCELGACSGPAQVVMQRGAVGIMAGAAQGVVSPTLKVSGSCASHMLVSDGGQIAVYPQVLTITGTPTFASGWFNGQRTGVISAPTGVLYSSVTGTANGPRYNAISNAVIDTVGATLPGSSAGTTSSGGQYL